jgi:DNA replication protein DnaC
MLALGVPPRFQDCSLANFSPQTLAARHARQQLQRFVQQYTEMDRGLLLQGGNASGKTPLVIGLMRLLLSESLAQPRFADTATLLRQLDIELDLMESLARRQYLDSIINCDLLILDDLNSGGDTDNQRAMLEYIIGYRYRQLLPVVITTRSSLSELQTLVGIGSCSRLIEMCEIIAM